MLNSPKQSRFGLPDNLGIYVCGSDGFKRFPLEKISWVFFPLTQILHLNWDCLYLYTYHQSLEKVFLKLKQLFAFQDFLRCFLAKF